VVAATIIDALEELDMAFPRLDDRQRRDMETGRAVIRKALRKTGSRS
jgi:hypothetical protein